MQRLEDYSQFRLVDECHVRTNVDSEYRESLRLVSSCDIKDTLAGVVLQSINPADPCDNILCAGLRDFGLHWDVTGLNV